MDKTSSHGFVWVEHHSDVGSHSLSWEVLSETGSNGTGVSVGSDNFTPHNSVSSIVHGVLALEDVSTSFSHIESGS